MMDLQAAIGIHQFDHIEIWLERRNEIWQRYAEELEDLPVVLPAPDDPRTRHARHMYTLMIDPETSGITRDEFMNRMHAKNIERVSTISAFIFIRGTARIWVRTPRIFRTQRGSVSELFRSLSRLISRMRT